MPRDALAYGLRTGASCCAVCGPAMLLVMSLSVHHIVMMLVAMTILTSERYLPPRRPAWRLPHLLATREPRWQSLIIPLPPTDQPN